MKKIDIGLSKDVVVMGTPGVDVDMFLISQLFLNWSRSVSPRFLIKSISVVSVDLKPSGAPIFANMNVEAYVDGERIVPDVVFLRGGSIAVLTILIEKETGRKHVVFVRQPRLAIGTCDFIEIPAGMLDGERRHFAGVAAKEMKEELGLEINTTDLVALTRGLSSLEGVAISPGACDETMRFFLFKKEMPRADILALEGKLTGNAAEGEAISLLLVSLDRAPKVTSDGKFFIAHALATLNGLI